MKSLSLIALFLYTTPHVVASPVERSAVSICTDGDTPQLLTTETSGGIHLSKLKCPKGFSKAITNEVPNAESGREISSRETSLGLEARQKGSCVNPPTYCVSNVLCNQRTCQPPGTTAPSSADCAVINDYLFAQTGTFTTNPYEYYEAQYLTCTYRWGNRRAFGFLEYSFWDWGNVAKGLYTTCVTNFEGTVYARGGGYCTTSGGITFFVQATTTGYALPFPY